MKKTPPLAADDYQQLLLHHKYLGAVRRLARGVSHSYNNIFTGLGGQTAMLRQDGALPCDLVDKRGKLIDELLQRGIEQTAILHGFARDGDSEQREHSPLGLAKKAADLLNSISRIHNIVQKNEVTEERIVGNARDIILLLFYLGENAVDATPGGGDITFLVQRTRGEQDHPTPGLLFSFIDQGPGFQKEIEPRLFAPFVTSRTDSPFSGLGLYAAQVLAGRNGGHLTINRRANDTTTVGVTLPLVVEEKTATTAKPGGASPEKGCGLQVKHCFLVVEDDEAMRTLLLNRLQRRGHIVFCVDTCAEALEEYHHLHDIITTVLMDIGLGDDSGLICQRKLLAINPDLRTIFMSGEQAMPPNDTFGKATFLHKPFTIDQLEEAVCDVHI